MSPLHRLTASEVLPLLKDGTITVESYAQDLLGRIQERDSIVHAWAYLDADFVINQAKQLDEIPSVERGPLHGLAIGFKDVIHTKDMPTQMGSPMYKDYRSNFDSSAVGILRAAGALIFGKTTTTEFCVPNSGPNTANPHDPERTPGGSSCGSAAAVADFQMPIALGAQTGGSLIRPASFTGVFAFKPTYNAVSIEGTKTISSSFDTLGWFARSIDDLQLVADIFALGDVGLAIDRPPEQNKKTALIKTPMWDQAGPGTIDAMEKAAAILINKGFSIEELSLPPSVNDKEHLKHLHSTIMKSEARKAFLREYRVDRSILEPKIRRWVEDCSRSSGDISSAYDQLASSRRCVDELAAGVTVILTPSVIDEAPMGLGDMGSPAFNTLWTGFHTPVLNVPAFTGSNGMPISISLVLGRYQDQQLLQNGKIISDLLMAESPWAQKLSSSGA